MKFRRTEKLSGDFPHNGKTLSMTRKRAEVHTHNIGADASSLRDSVRPLVGPDSPTTGKIQNGNFQ